MAVHHEKSTKLHHWRAFELEAREAIIRREEDRLVIEPVKSKGLLETLASLPTLEEDFPEVDADLPELDAVEL